MAQGGNNSAIIWTDKHNTAINRTYKHLQKSLEGCQSIKDCKAVLEHLSWPYGALGAEEPISGAVQKVMANRAVESRLHELMIAASPQGA
jgi:predicted TIM-barrel fold metal-dependent hydrolase